MEEKFRTIETINEIWPNLPKNEIWTRPRRRRDTWGVGFACEVGKLWVIIEIIIGPRNGIQETSYVLDPTQPVEIDRLVLARSSAYDSLNTFLPLVEMQIEIRSGKHPIAVCEEYEHELLKSMLAHPDSYLKDIAYMKRLGPEVEIPFVNGGLPGLGKHA